jgi:hemin uptake protein HemP
MPNPQSPLSTTPAHSAHADAPSRGTLSLSAGSSAARVSASAPRAVLAAQRAASALVAVDTVPLKRLTAGRKALKIAHAGETYLLRITKANKLILTKPATDKTPLADAKV